MAACTGKLARRNIAGSLCEPGAWNDDFVDGDAHVSPLTASPVGRTHRWVKRYCPTLVHSWSYLGSVDANPMGVEWLGMVMDLGFVPVVRILVHRFPRRAARDGRRLDEPREADATHCGSAEDGLLIPGSRS